MKPKMRLRKFWHEGPDAIYEFLQNVENGSEFSKSSSLYGQYGITADEIMGYVAEHYAELLPQHHHRPEMLQQLEAQHRGDKPVRFPDLSPSPI